MLATEWPHASQPLLDTLERSLTYEGDTHADVFRNIDVLWLDQGRTDCSRNQFEKYAECHLRLYRGNLAGWPEGASDPAIFDRLSASAARVDPPEVTPRDAIFADRITAKAAEVGRDRAIAIVGKDHSLREPGFMGRLLEDCGFTCQIQAF